MRADARRNRERLLDAGIELILEVGGEPARDAIATRAGVGVATLYRHFPDRQSLLQALSHHVLERTITAGEQALAAAASPDEALRRYLHLAIDNGLGAQNLIHPLLEERPSPDLRTRAERMLHAMVDGAREDGHVRSDVTARDIAFAIIRACRPLAVGIDRETERATAHRHMDVYFDGLARATPSHQADR